MYLNTNRLSKDCNEYRKIMYSEYEESINITSLMLYEVYNLKDSLVHYEVYEYLGKDSEGNPKYDYKKYWDFMSAKMEFCYILEEIKLYRTRAENTIK